MIKLMHRFMYGTNGSITCTQDAILLVRRNSMDYANFKGILDVFGIVIIIIILSESVGAEKN